MGLQAFEVQVCAKAETRGLEMAFFGKSPIGRRFCYFSIGSARASQVGFKQVFDNLTVKHMDALRKQIQSLADFVLNRCFWTYAMLRNFENDRKK